MIITTTRHGRTARDTRHLLAHLRKGVHQVSRVVAIGNVALSDADAVMAYMEAMRDGSRADVAYHHITISPSIRLTDIQRDEAVRRILHALDADDHAYVLWEHAEKRRHGSDVDQHFHLVLGHIGPDGKALRDSHSFRNLEAAARSLEVDFGERITASRRTAAVAARLVEMGREEVAQRLPQPAEPPRSSMTSTSRAAADRQGVDLPAAQDAVRAAWAASDSPLSFSHALAEIGLSVAPGRKEGVFVVTAGTVEIGALDRIVKVKRRDVAERMKGYENDSSKKRRPTRPDAGPESDFPRNSVGSSDSPAADPAPDAPGTACRGRRQPDRKAPGYPGGDLARPAASTREPRGSALEGRQAVDTCRLNAALKDLQLSPAAISAVAEIKARSLAGHAPRATSAVLDRQLSHGSRLDRLWRLAWDVREAIHEIRLRIRFGKVQQPQQQPLPDLEPAAAPIAPQFLFDRMRQRIEDRQRENDVVNEIRGFSL